MTAVSLSDSVASMFEPILISALKLIGFTGVGFALFSVPLLKRRVLTPFLFLTMNVLLPVYFIQRLPAGWADAIAGGWLWMLGFFAAFFVMTSVQAAIGYLLLRRYRNGGLSSSKRRIFIALAAVHNAGFIPLPILDVVAPQVITVYMFMYMLAFSLFMWSVAAPLVSGGGGFTLKLNGPLIGVVLGLAVAISGTYEVFPQAVRGAMTATADIALDCVLVALGGILATIPRTELQLRPELVRLTGYRFLLFPAATVAVALLIPLGSLSAEMQWGLRVALVLETAVPPATSLMLAAKQFGSAEDVSYLGSGILLTYAVSFVTIPLFLILATLLFR